ncbi:MAG: sugar ABC transporter ATP-binding protein [Holophagales bacterium]|nr:sugar ABC transporter ATP-binding protein [Holophagales bacterium]MYG32110.1 sugar ABC transporter ATP-binding protein [Holophagales bacterium]MYI80820.1 sugar ABC transporter ATP-binding protein [Holophagales bacterium]
MLELRAVGMQFGAVAALVDVDLELGAGEVVGLMGDNGAGKSTLLKIVAGNFAPTSGRVLWNGADVDLSPLSARELGIEAVYQDLALCDNLSAAANVFLGRELSRRLFGVLPVLDHAAMRRKSAELFAELGSDTRADDLVRQMSGGQRQAVAIARARLSSPRLVLLDEPTAAISVRQIAEVLELIRGLKQQDVGILLISHRMSDVFAVADRIVVLRRGRKVADKPTADSSAEEVTALITGAIEAA